LNNENELSYQKSKIVSYFKRGEKEKSEFKIGAEFEHFIIDKNTLETISYYGDKGVGNTLEQLLHKGWSGKYEGQHLMGLTKGGNNITLEPGSQLELSTKPCKSIYEIENEYLSFLKDIVPILNEKNQYINSLGYQPESKIEEIPFIPKDRYKYMSEYFKGRGKYAHNMMKGTASLQVTLDYCSEDDFMKKFRVANALSPIISFMFDNAPFFEGELWTKNTLRTHIWNNCDDDRCMVVPKALDKSFGYEDYSEYILNTPPIIIRRNNEFLYTARKPFKEIYDPNEFTIEELEHVLTMYFPDVRAKKFIEVRMADSVPYPFNISGIALWKGLIYDQENLDYLYDHLEMISNDCVRKKKAEIIESGKNTSVMDKNIFEVCRDIIALSERGLDREEAKYLLPLKELAYNERTLSLEIKEKIKLGKHRALENSFLNNIF
jgi:glutamate--cysteine ligase